MRGLIQLHANSFDHIHQVEIPLGDAAPLRPWKKTDACQVLGCELDFEPLGVCWKLAPHRSAPQEQQSPSQAILPRAGEIGLRDQTLKLLAIFLKLRMVKFTLEEFRNHFFFREWTAQTKRTVSP